MSTIRHPHHYRRAVATSQIVQQKPRSTGRNPFCPLGVTDRSPTYSLESFNNLAGKIRSILYRNNWQATQEIVVRFLKRLDKCSINKVRKEIFSHLRKLGINAIVHIEPTVNKSGKLNGRVHIHILTDDKRGEKFLRELFNGACLMGRLRNKAISGFHRNEFKVNYRRLTDYRKYIRYFTKHNLPHKIRLFTKGKTGEPGTRIQRFYFIGNCFIDTAGNPTTAKAIWAGIRQEMQEKAMKTRQEEAIASLSDDRIAKLQRIVNDASDRTLHDWHCVLTGETGMLRTPIPNWLYRLPERERDALLWVIDLRLRPTDFTKLGGMIVRENDIALYNWFSRLQEKPMMPNASLPKWLGWYLVQGRKRQELLDAIWARLRVSTNSHVIRCLRMCHGIVLNRPREPGVTGRRDRC